MSLLPGYCSIPGCERPRQGTLEVCASHNKVERDKEAAKSKPVKEPTPIRRVSTQQAGIKNDLNRAYAEKARLTDCQTVCSACEQSLWDDHDHSVSQKRCKELGVPELITNLDNFEYSCRQCHVEWESYKSGEFTKHKNFESRMAFVKIHDPEMYEKRMWVWAEMNKPAHAI